MTFAYPWILLLLPLALVALRERRLTAITVSGLAVWRNVPPSRRLRWLGRVRFMPAVAIGLLITACAGPQMERQVGEETREGVAIQLLVDISSSMDQSLAVEDGERMIATGGGQTGRRAIHSPPSRRSDRPDHVCAVRRYAEPVDVWT